MGTCDSLGNIFTSGFELDELTSAVNVLSFHSLSPRWMIVSEYEGLSEDEVIIGGVSNWTDGWSRCKGIIEILINFQLSMLIVD